MAAQSSDTLYEADTDGIIVRVTPRFVHDESHAGSGQYVWHYTVEIENGSSQTWTLMMRHWDIFDSHGRRQTVDGEGVVGKQPRLAPGESFEYSSGAPLAAPSGIMGGHYTMVNDSGEKLRTSIPTFSLDSPYEQTRPS
ncbi:Co2+/Mg2+ efflux protein ApaG [Henriciella sp.]|uniref:Co2+/Mg2+ efflux protein ApaG n=1 Tax=Henriciella sp. TaxID=1968823 RepID=UPI0026232E8A|nr:Co2+/Mg2+ efflux protein ApaG [Henriciella sp.]